MEKFDYSAPEFRVNTFDDGDVITASVIVDIPGNDDPIELPFIPAR